ncbi:MAG: ligase [Burkholderiales bacterium]
MLELGLREVHAGEEQAWNREALALPVAGSALACWCYAAPGLVLGAGQRATADLQARARERGIDVVNRISGGGAVLAGPWMLALSLLLPASHPVVQSGLHVGFRRLGAALCRAFGDFGVAARPASEADLQRSGARARERDLGWACFGAVSHGEAVDPAGRKLAGLAQCRKQTGTLLVAGVLLSEPDWPLLCELFAKPASVGEALRSGTASTASRHSRPPDAAAFCVALAREVRAEFTDSGENGRGGRGSV